MCTGACLVVPESAGIQKISRTTVGHERCADFCVSGRGGRLTNPHGAEQGTRSQLGLPIGNGKFVDFLNERYWINGPFVSDCMETDDVHMPPDDQNVFFQEEWEEIHLDHIDNQQK